MQNVHRHELRSALNFCTNTFCLILAVSGYLQLRKDPATNEIRAANVGFCMLGFDLVLFLMGNLGMMYYAWAVNSLLDNHKLHLQKSNWVLKTEVLKPRRCGGGDEGNGRVEEYRTQLELITGSLESASACTCLRCVRN